jgi:hypothetical protein
MRDQDCLPDGRSNSPALEIRLRIVTPKSEVIRKMEQDWDQRARENSRFFIDTEEQTGPKASFWRAASAM